MMFWQQQKFFWNCIKLKRKKKRKYLKNFLIYDIFVLALKSLALRVEFFPLLIVKNSKRGFMQSKVCSLVEIAVKDVLCNLGFELYDIEYLKKQNGMNLTLFITKLNGEIVNINDCELVHRTIDPILDEVNPTNDEPYYLNVSSVGLDRPIKLDKDFNRVLNHELIIKTFVPINKAKEFVGVLKFFDDKKIIVENNGATTEILRNNLALVRENIKF